MSAQPAGRHDRTGSGDPGRFGNILEERLRGPAGVIAAFAVLHALLVVLGYGLKENLRAPAVM